MPSVPTVTVVIPNYNHERYLPRRIESILGQTFADFELIIMDDCSIDNSIDVIKRYAVAEPRIRTVFNERNSGSTFKQWKKGLTLAKGRYLWIAESDDFAAPTFLENLVAILESDSTIGLAYSNAIIVDEHDQPIGKMADWKNTNFKTDRWDYSWVRSGLAEVEEYLGVTCTINNASSVLFRISAILKSGGIDDSFRYAGDWMTYIRLGLNNQIAYVSECLNYYREHHMNASKQSAVNGALIFERLLCLGYLHRHILQKEVSNRLLVQAVEEYSALIYNCIRRTWQPKLLGQYGLRLFKHETRFTLLLQMQAGIKLLRRQY